MLNPGTIILEIKVLIDKMVKLPLRLQSAQTVSMNGRWSAPCPGTIRINCDVSWCKQIGMGGLRVIARDSRGGVVGAVNW